MLLTPKSQDDEDIYVVQNIRSRVKRKSSDQDGTLSRSWLGAKLRPHKNRVLIHASFTSVVRGILTNLLIVMIVSFWTYMK